MAKIDDYKKSRALLHKSKRLSLVQLPFDSPQSQSAQSATLCDISSRQIQLLNLVLYYIRSESELAFCFRLLLDFQLSGGLRISECLRPAQFNISRLGQVFVPGSKGSNDKLITPFYFQTWWLSHGPVVFNPFNHVSRFVIYRLYKKLGINLINSGSLHAKITHSLRHLNVKLMQEIGLSNENLSLFIGHKSHKSIEWYAKD